MIPIENQELYSMISLIVTFIFGFGTKHYADIYANSKKKLSQIRVVSNFVNQKITEIDDALKDDQVDNAEFSRIFTIKTAEIEKAKAEIKV